MLSQDFPWNTSYKSTRVTKVKKRKKNEGLILGTSKQENREKKGGESREAGKEMK